MTVPFTDPFTVAASYNGLMHRIADREPAALAELYRLLARPTLGYVRIRTDDFDAAMAITQAAFVEMWRLAPVRRGFDDARGQLLSIVDRRIAEHLRSSAGPSMLGTCYDEHTRLELHALIRQSPRDVSPR